MSAADWRSAAPRIGEFETKYISSLKGRAGKDGCYGSERSGGDATRKARRSGGLFAARKQSGCPHRRRRGKGRGEETPGGYLQKYMDQDAN